LILTTLFCMSLFLYSCSLNGFDKETAYIDREIPKIKYIINYEKPSIKLKELSENYTNYDSYEVTSLSFELEKSQKMYLDYYNDRIFYDDNHRRVYKYFKEGFYKRAIESISDIKFKELMLEIYNSNYVLEKINDNYEVNINYKAYRKYYSSMNTEGRSYFYIKEREIEKPYMIDDELNIDLYELGDRIVETDDFILKYPFSKRINEMLYLNTERVWSILVGNEVSEVVGDDMVVKGNYRTLYRYLSSRISNKGFRKFLVGYIQLLENQEYRYDELASQYINTYDDFYNYDIPMYDDEKVIIEYMDGKRMGGNYNYPRIVGYSNKKKQDEFNKKLLAIVEEKISYEGIKGFYIGEIGFWSNYELSYNNDGIICFEILIDYDYKEIARTDYITRALTIDLKSAKIVNLDDIFINLESEKKMIINKIEDYLSFNDDRYLVDMNDFNNISNFEYILNDTSVDLLYDVFNKDNNFLRTIRIPIDFDGLTVKFIN
ncbi:MAG: hypothetical protein WBA54_05620, partial [Acidaminobacteraceae bacterium]